MRPTTPSRRYRAWRVCLIVVVLAAGCNREAADWEEAVAKDSAEAYKSYLEKHSAGEHAADAARRLAKINEELDWERTQSQATADAYEDYVKKYPQGGHVGEARKLRDEIIESSDWQAAKAANTIHSLESYLRKHPQSQRKSEVQKLLEPLREARDWAQALATNSVESVSSYLEKHRAGKHRTEATRTLWLLAGRQVYAKKDRSIGLDVITQLLGEGHLPTGLSPAQRQEVLFLMADVLDVIPESFRLSIREIQPTEGNGQTFIGQVPKEDGSFVLRPGSPGYPGSGLLADSVVPVRGKMLLDRSPSGRFCGFRGLFKLNGNEIVTELPDDHALVRLGQGGVFTRGLHRLIPMGDGTIIRFAGTCDRLFGKWTIVGNKEQPLCLVLRKGSGLTYLFGQGEITTPEGKTIRFTRPVRSGGD